MSNPVIAIFDIGKTNKKFFLFDEQYQIVFEQSKQFDEIVDEDGDSCDDVKLLSAWIINILSEIISDNQFDIKAVNFSTYGASLVHIDALGNPVTPLYNYLKPYPSLLKQQFYEIYGGETQISLDTASPILGNLNSGMQLYWLKSNKTSIYQSIKSSLHLPQYLSYLITQQVYTDITSIGCHTQLWNFKLNQYHQWVTKENIIEKLPALYPSNNILEVTFKCKRIKVGIGLHDSSAALIPYLTSFTEPFILISTGTWCISLNPFNNDPLTIEELQQDCLCFKEFKGTSVKASRLFAGYLHEQQTKRIASHFMKRNDYFNSVSYNDNIISETKHFFSNSNSESTFRENDLTKYSSYEEAYHHLIFEIILQQHKSTSLIFGKKPVNRIFVDGGFGKNEVYMNMLAKVFPSVEVFAASVAQASAIGTALSIHSEWNNNSLPRDMITLKKYNLISYG